jgi:hypothetical protein
LDQDLSSPTNEVGENDKSTISDPTYLIHKNHLAQAASAVADNHERQQHTEKLISPHLKTSEKTKLLI